MIERTDPATARLDDGRQVSWNLQGIEPSHRARYEWAIRKLEKLFPKGAHILDAACGCGYGSKMLAEAGHKVTGIDISEAAIEFAKDHYADLGVKYVCGDLLEMPLPEADVIVSFETIEHVERDLDLVYAFSKSADYLFTSVPNLSTYPCKGHVARHHWRHYYDWDFRQLVESCGYRIVQSGSLNKWEEEVSPDTERAFMVYMAEL